MREHKVEALSFAFLFLFALSLILFPSFFQPFSRKLFIVNSTIAGYLTRKITSIRDLFLVHKQLSQLRQEYETFLRFYARSQEQSVPYTQLKQENIELRKLLKYSYLIQQKYQVAKVSLLGESVHGKSIQLQVGSVSGVKKDAAVLALSRRGRLMLVGSIRKVGLHVSIVAPLTDMHSHIAVRLKNSRYDGLLSGDGKKMMMEYVDALARPLIRVGDEVVTAQSSSLVPPDIYVGTVSNIIQKTHKLSLDLEIIPASSFHNLEYVLIVSMENK